MLKTVSSKITLGIVLITVAMVLLAGAITVRRTEAEFQTFLQEQIAIGYYFPQAARNNIERRKQIEDNFVQNLYISTISVVILASGVSIVFGAFAAHFITRPLSRLKAGIQNLKQNKYKIQLDPTGQEEFDQVIYQLNALAKALDRADILRSDLISDISHELKTPITALSGQIEGIKDGIFEPNAKRIEVITTEIDRLNTLINQLQNYTRLRSKLAELSLEEVNLNDMVENLETQFESRLRERKIKIVGHISAHYKLRADKILLERILSNLIENSIKYSNGTEIEIIAESGEIAIADNGVGIDDIHKKYVFERFYRVEKSRNRATGGLGLGLAIVKEMVEAHGWSIELTDNSPAGAKFKIITTSHGI